MQTDLRLGLLPVPAEATRNSNGAVAIAIVVLASVVSVAHENTLLRTVVLIHRSTPAGSVAVLIQPGDHAGQRGVKWRFHGVLSLRILRRFCAASAQPLK